MTKKKTDPATKARVTALHGRLCKVGPMKHRNEKRSRQKQNRYDQEAER